MPFIVGNSSTLDFGGFKDGIVSFSFDDGKSFSPLYQLGSDYIYAVQTSSTPTLSVVIYGGAGSPEFTNITTPNCEDSALRVRIRFNPGMCSDPTQYTVTGEFFVTGYSYSKDVQGIAQETWSLIGKPTNDVIMMEGNTFVIDSLETAVPEQLNSVVVNGAPIGRIYMEGMTEGEVGVQLYESDVQATSYQVSAGDIGQIRNVTSGFVQSFGNSTVLKKDGVVADASVTIEYNTIYVE